MVSTGEVVQGEAGGEGVTTEEMRVAAAGSVGWTDCFIATGKEEFLGTFAHEYEGRLMGFPPDSKGVEIVPSYDKNLNDIGELVATLDVGFDGSEADGYQHALFEIVNPSRGGMCEQSLADVAYLQAMLEASAIQKLEAYLRAKLWRE